MSSIAPAATTPSLRLTSLDQFRGYTMFGMILVNFLGGYKVCPYILKHHHDYCSYADTIMPQFLFAAGFAMRLSLGRRIESGGKMPWGRAVRRVLGLAFVAIAWYSFCDLNGIIHKFQTQNIGSVLYVLSKRELYQTLLHIAVTSLWILPVIASSWKVRLGYAIASGLLHVFISWWFNFAWVYSDPSGVDGGPLGFLTWAVPALCGTLACDAVRASGTAAAFRIALSGCFVMVLGWGLSMGTTLYDVPADQIPPESETPAAVPAKPSEPAEPKPVTEVASTSADPAAIVEAGEAEPKTEDKPTEPPKPAPEAEKRPAPKPFIAVLDPNKFAPDPVIPTWERLQKWDGKIVEPPFVPPPNAKHRRWNYWMMSQRGGTLSYPTFAAGLALVIYAGFLWICDGLKFQLGFFRTLGTNSLAAYMLHDIAHWIPVGGKVLDQHFPQNSTSVPWTLLGFGVSTLFVYGVCRLLERMGWYIRV